MSKYKVRRAIYGFENIDEVELETNDGISAMLKSSGEEYLQLTLLHTYYEQGDFQIPGDIKALLDIHENSNISVYLIVILNTNISDSTINLGAPLIFNEDNHTMGQALLDNNEGTISNLFKISE